MTVEGRIVAGLGGRVVEVLFDRVVGDVTLAIRDDDRCMVATLDREATHELCAALVEAELKSRPAPPGPPAEVVAAPLPTLAEVLTGRRAAG